MGIREDFGIGVRHLPREFEGSHEANALPHARREVAGSKVIELFTGVEGLAFISFAFADPRQDEAARILPGTRAHRPVPSGVVPGNADCDVVRGQAAGARRQVSHRIRLRSVIALIKLAVYAPSRVLSTAALRLRSSLNRWSWERCSAGSMKLSKLVRGLTPIVRVAAGCSAHRCRGWGW